MSLPDLGLTWGHLYEWAGQRIVERGASYMSGVEDLQQTDDGLVLAWVEGRRRYATVVGAAPSGALVSTCTCPYEWTCKHAVAVLLVWAQEASSGAEVPLAEADDRRLVRRAGGAGDPRDLSEIGVDFGSPPDAELDWEHDIAAEGDDDDDDLHEVDEFEPARPPFDDPVWAGAPGPPRWGSGAREAGIEGRPVLDPALRRYLAGLSPEDLAGLLTELAADIPQVRDRLSDRAALASGRVSALVAATRLEIESVSSEAAWWEPWSGEGHIPDYSGVRRRLRSLLASGQADAVVALGEDLLDLGLKQVAQSDDDGQTAAQLADCLSIVLQALRSSSMIAPERLLWEIDARLSDEHGVLDGLEGILDDDVLDEEEEVYTPADWSEVADRLSARLVASPGTETPAPRTAYATYRRGALVRAAANAMQCAGRDAEVAALLEREVEATHGWVELVDHLLARNRVDEALSWARRGFARTHERYAGTAASMLARMVEAAGRADDRPLAAAIRAEMFFRHPSVESFEGVREATEALGLWEATRPHLLAWLETGVRPGGREGKGSAAAPQDGATSSDAVERAPRASWPLQDAGLGAPPDPPRHAQWMARDLLIDIALHEDRLPDALTHFDRACEDSRHALHARGGLVAEAVRHEHPDRALAIWRELALGEIAQVNKKAYERAGALLWRMHGVYEDTGRLEDWRALLAELRQANRRRPRMIEVLDRLDAMPKRIVSS